MRTLDAEKALVLLSGGQDSTTCLAWALERFPHVETIGFKYGQRHVIELDCRARIRTLLPKCSPKWSDRLGEDHMIDLAVLGDISQTALTRDVDIELTEEGLPSTFVPGRNLLFLTFAAAVAYRRGIRHIVSGVCETDYSGYPDCRDDTIKGLQLAINLGMDARFVLHTPLMWIDKASTWALSAELGGEELVSLVTSETHSCYLGQRDVLHEWGYGCSNCPACVLRREGYVAYTESLRATGSGA